MTAAALQGAMASTLDTDVWIDLPTRQYLITHSICREQGGEVLAKTVIALTDGLIVNFLYQIDGLGSFENEYPKAKKLLWNRMRVSVLPLESIIQSKKHIRRPKDLAHLPLLEKALKAQRKPK